MSCHLKSRKNCGGSFVIVTLYAARVRLWSKAEVKKRWSFLMHLLKATWERNIGAPDGKYSLWWQTSYPLGRWGSLFQPLIAIATTLPDATGWYMEELLLFKPGEKENANWTCKIRTFCFFHNESTSYSRCSFRRKTSEIAEWRDHKTPCIKRIQQDNFE